MAIAQVDASPRASAWTNTSLGNQVERTTYVVIRNRTSKPICNVKVEIIVTFQSSRMRHSRIVPFTPLVANGNITQNVLMPMHTSRQAALKILLPATAWRRDAIITTKVASYDVFKPKSDLHDPLSLYHFLFFSDLQQVKATFGKDKTLLKVRSANGFGPLHFALTQGDPAIVKYLQSLGCNIHENPRGGQCAYHFAALGQAEMVAYVKSQKVKPTLTGQSGRSPYFYAMEQGNLGTFRAMLDAKVPINVRSKTGESVLLSAVRSGGVDYVQLLVDAGAKIKDYDQFGNSPRVAALMLPDPNVRDRMLRILGGHNDVSPDGSTPLHHMVRFQRFEGAMYLLQRGVNVNAKNKKGLSPLDLAKQIGHPSDRELWVSILKQAGAKER